MGVFSYKTPPISSIFIPILSVITNPLCLNSYKSFKY